MVHTLSSRTHNGYQRHFDALSMHYKYTGVPVLPFGSHTVLCYTIPVFSSGTVRRGSLRPYFSAVGTQYHQLGLEDPGYHPLVQPTRRGFLILVSSRTNVPPVLSGSLPATLSARSVHSEIIAPSLETLQKWGLFVVLLLHFGRLSSIRHLCRTYKKFCSSHLMTLRL